MKRKYYKIHHRNYARPMKRVKRRHVSWQKVLLAALALVLLAVGVLAVLKWISLGRPDEPAQTEPTAIPIATAAPDGTEEAGD